MKKIGTGWVWGLVLILLGVGFLFDALGVSSVRTIIGEWWPMILVIVGLVNIFENNTLSGITWLVAGVILSLFTLDIVNYNGSIWSIVWPLILILFGVRSLFRSAFNVKTTTDDANYVSSTALFSGAEKKISSKNFRGSSLKAAFGGAKLDLRDAIVSKEGAIIDVSAIFGGAEILVPKKNPVRADLVAIFGGHDDKRDMKEIDDSAPTIVIRGEVIFGGIEIKN